MHNFKAPLENDKIRLSPMLDEHFVVLHAVASEPAMWEQHDDHDRGHIDKFKTFFAMGLANPEGCFSIVDKTLNKIIGSTRYYAYDSDEPSVKIGYTFISTEYWGTSMNSHLKELMLDHAFKFVENVYFDIWEHNYRSQKATEKLGAKQLQLQKTGRYLYLLTKNDWQLTKNKAAN